MRLPLPHLKRQITQEETSQFGWEGVNVTDSTAITTAIIAASSALAGVLVSIFAQFWVSKYTFQLQEKQTRKARLRSRCDELASSVVRCRQAVVDLTREVRKRDFNTDLERDRTVRQAWDNAELSLHVFEETMHLAQVDGCTWAIQSTAFNAYVELAGAIHETQEPRQDPSEYSEFIASGGKVGPGGAFVTAVDNLLEAIALEDYYKALGKRGGHRKWRLFVNWLRRRC